VHLYVDAMLASHLTQKHKSMCLCVNSSQAVLINLTTIHRKANKS